jgi:hypothetical protein
MHAPLPTSSRAFQRDEEHDLKHPVGLVTLIGTKQNYLPSKYKQNACLFCTGFGCVMDTRRAMMPLSGYYTPKVCITQPNFFVSGHHPSKSGQGQTRKRRSRKFFCTIRRTHC